MREAMGLSLRDLSERSGVSPTMLSQVERGGTSPTLAVAEKIAERGHFICPYSNATKGNIEVVTELA